MLLIIDGLPILVNLSIQNNSIIHSGVRFPDDDASDVSDEYITNDNDDESSDREDRIVKIEIDDEIGSGDFRGERVVSANEKAMQAKYMMFFVLTLF